MAAGLTDAARVVDEALTAFDPELLSGDDCATAEGALLVKAREGLGVLKDEARKVRLSAIDVDELRRRQREARHVRRWTNELGMVAGSFAVLPEDGVAFVNRLDAETDRLRRRAKA